MKSVVCRKSWQVHVGPTLNATLLPTTEKQFQDGSFCSLLLVAFSQDAVSKQAFANSWLAQCTQHWQDFNKMHFSNAVRDEIHAAQLKSAKFWSNIKCQLKSWKYKYSAKLYCRIYKLNLILPRSCIPWNKCRAEVYFMNYKLAWHLKSTLVRQLKFWNPEIHERRGRTLFYEL